LQTQKYILMLGGSGGMTIELEAADLSAACDTADGFSQLWQIERMQVHVDSVQLTSEMTNNFADMLIKDGSILIPYSTNSGDKMYLNGGANQVLILAKQYSRLATVMVSLVVADADTVNEKEMNNFYLARASSEVVESHISCNGLRWPMYNIVGTKQHYHRLLQSIGVWNSASHAVNISAAGYGDGSAVSTQFVIGFDLESVPGSDSSGLAVQGGAQVQIVLSNVGAPTVAYVTIHFNSVLEMRSMGAINYS
jgi:hypothetical protein